MKLKPIFFQLFPRKLVKTQTAVKQNRKKPQRII